MLTILLALGLALLAVLAAQRTYSSLLSRVSNDSTELAPVWRKLLILTLLSSPIWLGLAYLLPLPLDVWVSLSGREPYVSALQGMRLSASDSLPLSLSPDATWAALLSGVPLVALFWMALHAPTSVIKSLLMTLLAAATVQVLLSVFQLAFGGDSIFYFDLNVGGSVVGSFANRNHLANFLAVVLPVCIYVFFDQSKKKKYKHSSSDGHSRKQIILPTLIFLGFSYLLILLATLSRGGLISGFIVLGVSICIYLLALGAKTTSKQRLAYLAMASVFVALAMLASGIEGIQSRLGEKLLTDAEVRNTISSATMKAAWQFWPWGAGMGSFEAVFPRFQPPINLGSLGYIEYAHNDYAQLLMEFGAAGVLLMVAFATLLIHQVLNVVRVYRVEQRLPKDVVMQCFCGVGLMAFLLHSWVEFNMHIPALAMTAAFLSGVFLRTTSLDKTP